MAGKSYIKVGTYDWDRIKKMYIKTGGQTWSAIRKAYVKTDSGLWKKVFDTASNRPFIAGNDIPKIRLNTFRTGSSYNPTGTLDDPVDPVVEAPPVQQMGPSWTSPTLGWPYESLGRHLWGYDGTWTSGNGSNMTFTYTWLYNLTGNSNDNTPETNATSTTGRTDMLTNLSSHIGKPLNGIDGDYFDKNFLTFRVTATNSAGNASAESAPVYIVREVPTGSITMVSQGTAFANYSMDATFTYSNNWYNKTNVSNSYIEWFAVNNLGDALTSNNRVEIQNLSSIAVTGTTSKSGTTSHVPTIASKYYYVKMTLNNSSTENAVIAINGFTPKSPVTAQANKTALTSAPLTAPTISSITYNGSSVSINFSGGSGPYYELYWSTDPTAANGLLTNYYDAASTSSPLTESIAIAAGATRYFWLRSSSVNRGNTTASGNASDGTFGPWASSGFAFTRPVEYTVNWNGNGGSSGNEGIPWSFTAGGSVTVPSASRIGFTFERWADTSSGSYTYTTTNVGGLWYPPSETINMYARWQINVCTVPNVIGMTEINASNALNNAGFLYEYTYYVNTSNSSLNGTVQAVDPGVGTQPGCGSNVDLYIYNYVAAPVKLSTPTGVNATDDRTDGSNVTWNAVSGASYYGIWWGGQPGYDTAPDFPNIYATSYLDTAITVGNTRAYYVQAYASGNPAGTKSDWSSYEVGSRVNPSPTITYGECTTYGSPYYSTSGYECYGTYSYAYNDNYYYQRRQILSNGTWNGSYDYSCGNTSLRTYGSISEVNGQCGYSPQPVCISYKYVCKYYDAYNSNSNNYSTCYYEGECAANNNSDGSRSTCCAAYS